MTSDALPTSKQIAIDIATPLGIKPEKLVSVLKVEAGQTIVEGTVLAQKKSFLSLGKTEVKSPVAGEIVKLDEKNGTVIVALSESIEVKTEPEPEVQSELTTPSEAPYESEPETPKKKKISKTSTKAIKKTKDIQTLVADFGFGTGKGIGIVLKPKQGELNIRAEHRGSILVTNSLPSKKDMYKASAIGVEAIVVFGQDPQLAQSIKEELDGKAQIALLIVANDELNWEQLEGMLLEVEGKSHVLHMQPAPKD